MVIDIRGVGFENHGAELMLHAIVEHFRAHGSRVVLTMNANGTREQRRALGLAEKLPPPRGGRARWKERLLPAAFRIRRGTVAERDIDAVLDASGFAYSDQWGPYASEQLARFASSSKKAGRKLILLPQAFGPLENPGVRKALTEAWSNLDLVYARDRQSEAYLRAAGLGDHRLRVAPDFTSLVPNVPTTWTPPAENFACVVPNFRMLDMTGDGEGATYIKVLAQFVDGLRAHSVEPVLLIHGDEADEKLVRALEARCGRIAQAPRWGGVQLKGILKSARVIVGSRFHALMGGLTQAVPCIGTGWSHKYQELFSDFQCPDLLLDLSRHGGLTDDEVRAALVRTIEEPGRTELIQRLRAAGEGQKRQINQMWSEVDATLGLTPFRSETV